MSKWKGIEDGFLEEGGIGFNQLQVDGWDGWWAGLEDFTGIKEKPAMVSLKGSTKLVTWARIAAGFIEKKRPRKRSETNIFSSWGQVEW